ncbi:MAG TPA: CocE/NonD family hydrolase, partial [Candidatus Thermoplasmatota archaeon]|nr:CocE/NonD family hydrolase [Candidatus Thermoplasmatota archaeon]
MRPAVAIVLLALLVPGCLSGFGAPDGREEPPPAPVPRGHPWPDGPAWPEGLQGPFGLKSIERVTVESFDSVALRGWVLLPDLPAGTKAPVVLVSSPYWGQQEESPEHPDFFSRFLFAPTRALLENGYALGIFNVRGTGGSGGCFELWGPREQRDQAVLVEWLSREAWSNGRVGMMGLSYPGTTPWMAAIQNPPALKTLVVAGTIGDPYTWFHTPQGAASTGATYLPSLLAGLTSFGPRMRDSPDGATVNHLSVLPERLCPEVARVLTAPGKGSLDENRDAAFWNERRFTDHMANVTAATFIVHGFQDNWVSGHAQQDDPLWPLLAVAPKRLLLGQWEHEWPDRNSVTPEWSMPEWNATLLHWLDYWLKGVGPAPPLGVVDYQEALTGTWRASTAWPPAEARSEVLYLSKAGLSPATGGPSATLRALPQLTGATRARADPSGSLCTAPADGTGLVAATDPVPADVVLAGNPFAYLRLTSDAPEGIVSVHLYDLAPDFQCVGAEAKGARRLAGGAADLRFHEGNLAAKPFPTGTPAPVRVDLPNLVEPLPAGHRLAVLVSRGDVADRVGRSAAPALVIHSDEGAVSSHLV